MTMSQSLGRTVGDVSWGFGVVSSLKIVFHQVWTGLGLKDTIGSVWWNVGQVLPVYQSLCAVLNDPFLEEKHIVTDACGHWTLKRIAAISRSDCKGFPAIVVETVSPKQLQGWTRSNRGCFVINR